MNGEAKTVFHSAFNTDWLIALGITPDTIVDPGSFYGGDAYRFKATFPDARVITVEADPARYAVVTENLSGQAIDIANHAACGTAGDIDWYPAVIDGEADAQGSIFKHTEAYRKIFNQVEQAKPPDSVACKPFLAPLPRRQTSKRCRFCIWILKGRNTAFCRSWGLSARA